MNEHDKNKPLHKGLSETRSLSQPSASITASTESFRKLFFDTLKNEIDVNDTWFCKECLCDESSLPTDCGHEKGSFDLEALLNFVWDKAQRKYLKKNVSFLRIRDEKE